MKTILLIGKTGQVGHELISALAPLGRVIAFGRDELDLSRPDSIVSRLRDIAPDIVVNAAAYTAVDDAESEPEIVMQVNAAAPGIIAEEIRRRRGLLVHYSTDYVYDGSKTTPYLESDRPNPVNLYGRSKLEGERNIAASGCRHLIFRTSWLYADRGVNFLLTILQLARQMQELHVVTDQIGSPTWAKWLARATARTLHDPCLPEKLGTYHLSAGGYTSRFSYAEEILRLAAEFSGSDMGWANIIPCITSQFPRPAKRPLNASTSKDLFARTFGNCVTDWSEQLHSCMQSLPWPPPPR